ncbi:MULTISPECIES: aminodeoxychorismate synthase component I [Microvirga]|uniref:aminodeoxychorismate synthase component I n=1 Tax=Microvirga TaxID=186650 RepID=UPI000E0DB544|nr:MULTISPECIES: aminodeoxychorismate synthase component I [Microvirga]MBQ0819511.1 aminodeoxychorismate synthase component I [Microvirga sp. HBU67558]
MSLFVLPLPFRDPLVTFQAFAFDPYAALLDSASTNDERSRYAYIAVEPFRVIAAHDEATINGVPVRGDPFTVLERELAAHRLPAGEIPVPFGTGAVGFFGYGLGRHLEALPEPAVDHLNLPEMVLGLYDVIVAFDLRTRQSWVVSSGVPEKSEAARRQRAEERGKAVAARMEASSQEIPSLDWSPLATWQYEQARDTVEASISKVIDYIRAGDIFQANLTQRYRASRPKGLNDFMLYRRLRALSPSPFAAFLRCGPGLSVASASPERFLQLDPDGHVETRPIKGTRRRDPNPTRDAALALELTHSAKDRAENTMIVDLMRNDLGRVCTLGSIHVPQLCGLETFASVHHLVSAVQGKLRPEFGLVDLLRASFPGGSITGAPKIRAMEIIAELESAPRGVYCGSIAWIGFDGAMDSNIAIRTLTCAGDTILAQAGGGITADSCPELEFKEAMVKLRPLLQAVAGRAA